MQELNLTVFDFAIVVFTSGATIISAILAVLIFRSEQRANRWLALLLGAASCYIASQLINFGNFTSLSQIYYYPPLRFTFSLGPLLYFFVRQSVTPNRKWRPLDWLHLVVPITQAVLTLWLGFQSSEMKHLFWINVDRPWYGLVDSLWTPISMLGYSFAAWRYLQRHRKTAVSQNVHTLEKFLRPIFRLFLLCAAVALFIDTLFPRIAFSLFDFYLEANPIYHSTPVVIYSLSLMWVSISGFIMAQSKRAESIEKQRKETYGLAPQQLIQYAEALNQLMVQEAPYLDSALTLSKLANQLDIPPKHLSYTINEKYDKSFNQLINELRVEAASKMLQDQQNRHKSILEIALEVGFSSKSTFNRTFRELKGMTPSKMRA
ncbi:MAG: helix-turn-helix domain-containing protein [Chloroflexota bacterium]